jgi:hypothetical protein
MQCVQRQLRITHVDGGKIDLLASEVGALKSALKIFSDRQLKLTPAHADALSRLASVRQAQLRRTAEK